MSACKTPSGVPGETCLLYVPHEDLLDLVGVDAGASDVLLHNDGTERRRRNLGGGGRRLISH
jgi:hypothetical protein